MTNRGKRYDGEPKLNFKKVVAVILAIIVVTMIILIVRNVLENGEEKGKITSQTYFTSYKDNKYGIIDSLGNSIINPSYQELIIIPNNKKDIFICTYDVNYENGIYKTKVLNSKNEEIFKEYEKVEAIFNSDENNNIWYEEDVLKVTKEGKYGLIDVSGKEILKPEYDEISAVTGIIKALKVKKEEKYGIISNEGKQIINTEYSDITNLGKDNKDGYIIKNEEGKYGIIDYSNKIILDMKYNKIEKNIYGNNLYVVTESKKQKVIDKEGKEIITKEFDSIINISQVIGENSGVIFEKSKKYGFMDLEGNIKINAKYDKLAEAKQGYLIAKTGNLYGVIDLEENEKIQSKYNLVTYNKKADIYIAEDDKFNSSILNTNFEEKLNGILLEINTQKDYIKMRIGDEYKYYNFKFEEKETKTILTSNNLFLSKKDGKYGFIDKTGKVIVEYKYDDATEQNSCGYAGIKKDGKWGSIDNKGNIGVEPTYNLENYLEIDFVGKWHKGIDLNMNYYNQE